MESGETFQTFAQSTSYRNDTLIPYATYNFSVAAATSVGTGPFSPVITVNTPESSTFLLTERTGPLRKHGTPV